MLQAFERVHKRGQVMQRSMRTGITGALLVATMSLGLAPAALAMDTEVKQDNDIATAVGGNGGNGGLAVGIGVCAIQIAVVGNAGCPNNGVADASGGDGGHAKAVADEN